MDFLLIANYLMANFSHTDEYDGYIQGFSKIINNFEDRQKWSIVEFLSNKMLSCYNSLKCNY